MEATKRQAEILNTIVREYISSVQPVSSQMLEKKYDFGISPATIRIEMRKLTDLNYLFQPYSSSGRIPTDKGYRFFVDNIIKSGLESSVDKKFLRESKKIKRTIDNYFKFTQLLTKKLASASSNLAVIYLIEKDFLCEEGWEKVFQEPEFRDLDFFSRFVKMIDDFEKKMSIFIKEEISRPKIYIGKENFFSRAKEFSIVISRCHFSKKQEGMIAILGPKRMAYHRNIILISSVIKSLENHSAN